ncbi:MAG: alpha/beta fold hydrolase [Actinomycetota bacterium]
MNENEPVELAAIERGAGTPVVLVHGGIFHSGPAWGRVINPLAVAGYRTLAVDRRGHGRSPAGDAAHVPVRLQATDVLRTLDLRGVDEAHLVAVSYGCLVCLEVALVDPGRVLSLALLEPPLFAWLARDPQYREWWERMRAAMRRGVEGEPLEEWLPDFMRFIDGRMAEEMNPSSPSWELIRRQAPVAEREQRSWEYVPDEEGLQSLDIPALVLNGDQSEPPMQVVGETLAAVLRHGHHVFIRDAGHDAHARNADAFNRLLLDFLASHTP